MKWWYHFADINKELKVEHTYLEKVRNVLLMNGGVAGKSSPVDGDQTYNEYTGKHTDCIWENHGINMQTLLCTPGLQLEFG